MWTNSRTIVTGNILLFQIVTRCAILVIASSWVTTKGAVRVSNTEDGYLLLASAISERVVNLYDDKYKTRNKPVDADYVAKVATSLKTMANAQAALKSLDGAAHEAYQRTQQQQQQQQKQHLLSKSDTKIIGRTARSAARTGCVADALHACELAELIEFPELNSMIHANSSNGTLLNREVLLNTTITLETDGLNHDYGTSDVPELSLIVLYDPNYNGGGGVSHGGLDYLIEEEETSHPCGRILVLLSDNFSNNLEATLRYLDLPPYPLTLKAGLVANEAVSVHKNLWKTAGRVLEKLAPTLLAHGAIQTNSTASPVVIHFVGRSLSGGVAGLAATILDGTLPMPNTNTNKEQRKSKRKRQGRSQDKPKSSTSEESAKEDDHNSDDSVNQRVGISISYSSNDTQTVLSHIDINGFGRGRTSAMLLGPPPCLSSNVRATFATSIVYGDDIVPRTTHASLDRLCRRVNRHVKGGIFGKRLGLVTDAVTLTMSNLKTHVAGSEGEESRLSLPGRGFLVRPRRLGGVCSIHEVGGVSGREGLRAALLWQLGDILLGKSLWKHHSLHSYIHGLDRVQLRTVSGGGNDKTY